MYTRRGYAGFTLVELIVVITIIGILSTIGFVSYSNYLTGARDSNRISQMVKLSDALQVYSANKSLPLPETKVDIVAGGASNIIGYQGFLGDDILETIDFTNGGKDPKDKTNFTYYLKADRTAVQLLAFLEEPPSLSLFSPHTYAVDYEDRYPKVYGKKLGVLVSDTTGTKNTPVQELTGVTSIDIVNTASGFVSYISDETKITGTGLLLREIIPNGSCNRIKQSGGGSTSGIYSITPGGTAVKQAYCDMETSGGGWTLVARSVSGGTGGFVLATATGSVTNLTQPYIFGTTGLIFGRSMLATIDTGRIIERSKTITSTPATLTFTNSGHTLTASGMTGGVANDGYNGRQGMLFVK